MSCPELSFFFFYFFILCIYLEINYYCHHYYYYACVCGGWLGVVGAMYKSSEEGIRYPKVGVTDGFKLAIMGAGN